MGGILYIFTGFQLANFFPGGRSTVCALLIGSYNASALVYPILKAFYTKVNLTPAGVPRPQMDTFLVFSNFLIIEKSKLKYILDDVFVLFFVFNVLLKSVKI